MSNGIKPLLEMIGLFTTSTAKLSAEKLPKIIDRTKQIIIPVSSSICNQINSSNTPTPTTTTTTTTTTTINMNPAVDPKQLINTILNSEAAKGLNKEIDSVLTILLGAGPLKSVNNNTTTNSIHNNKKGALTKREIEESKMIIEALLERRNKVESKN